eukprot:Skav223951  [mRNA]  locus=scaffold798:204713:207030:- [translate_table: standard]
MVRGKLHLHEFSFMSGDFVAAVILLDFLYLVLADEGGILSKGQEDFSLTEALVGILRRRSSPLTLVARESVDSKTLLHALRARRQTPSVQKYWTRCRRRRRVSHWQSQQLAILSPHAGDRSGFLRVGRISVPREPRYPPPDRRAPAEPANGPAVPVPIALPAPGTKGSWGRRGFKVSHLRPGLS